MRQETDLGNLINLGVNASTNIYDAVRIYAQYGNEKLATTKSIMGLFRRLAKATDTNKPLRELSIASSDEPQIELLEAAFTGGVCLLDINQKAIDKANERIARHSIEATHAVHGDYTKDFADTQRSKATLANKLGGYPFDLILLNQCLYYCDRAQWKPLVENLANNILGPVGAIRIQMMSAGDPRKETMTWIFEHFAERHFDHQNEWDLLQLAEELCASPSLKGMKIEAETFDCQFYVEDFEKYMAVIWMGMLDSYTFDYTREQKEEITSHMLENFWLEKKLLLAPTDCLIISRGLEEEN